jgi:hypothetical protein
MEIRLLKVRQEVKAALSRDIVDVHGLKAFRKLREMIMKVKTKRFVHLASRKFTAQVKHSSSMSG